MKRRNKKIILALMVCFFSLMNLTGCLDFLLDGDWDTNPDEHYDAKNPMEDAGEPDDPSNEDDLTLEPAGEDTVETTDDGIKNTKNPDAGDAEADLHNENNSDDKKASESPKDRPSGSEKTTPKPGTKVNMDMWVMGSVNFRKNSNTHSDIISVLSVGTKVKALEKTPDGWYKVDFEGTPGYVSGKYLSSKEVVVTKKDPPKEKPKSESKPGSKPDTADTGESPKPDSKKQSNSKYLADVEKGILKLCNKERQALGLTTLKWSDTARKIGRKKSKEMYDKDYFAHESPYSGSVANQFELFGGLVLGKNASMIGENIAFAEGYEESEVTAKFWVNIWMNSEGHKANILQPDYEYMGVGVYLGEDGRVYASQEFHSDL
ncbi:MAG TPA: CAP domain-containing protein [Clostridia bacterium]|nr:CAP domain-containing protein [Clostridia bacterium]